MGHEAKFLLLITLYALGLLEYLLHLGKIFYNSFKGFPGRFLFLEASLFYQKFHLSSIMDFYFGMEESGNVNPLQAFRAVHDSRDLHCLPPGKPRQSNHCPHPNHLLQKTLNTPHFIQNELLLKSKLPPQHILHIHTTTLNPNTTNITYRSQEYNPANPTTTTHRTAPPPLHTHLRTPRSRKPQSYNTNHALEVQITHIMDMTSYLQITNFDKVDINKAEQILTNYLDDIPLTEIQYEADHILIPHKTQKYYKYLTGQRLN
jgi:hypothetical protein